MGDDENNEQAAFPGSLFAFYWNAKSEPITAIKPGALLGLLALLAPEGRQFGSPLAMARVPTRHLQT